MYQLDFNKPVNVYFCGIGGISMSGLAQVLIDAKFNVQGSDMKQSELTDLLKKLGATVYIGQKEENITNDIDVFVYTAAIHNDHPEYSKAKELNIPVLTRAELLGQIMKNYELPIAVSGTHGKTTVTSMVSQILIDAKKDPTLSVGGILESIGGNFKIGHSDLFVTEACEYTNSFLSFYPKISIILNVEEDHLDFFKDIHDIRNSFNKFAKLNPNDGLIIIGQDIPQKETILKDVDAEVVTFGLTEDADYFATDIHCENGKSYFTVCVKDREPQEFSLKIPGKHNILNALAAIALADYLDVDRNIVKSSLDIFGGAKRRFEYKGELNGMTIIDDYAHHPSEIEATLLAARDYTDKKIWCLFQPHTYTRTKAFMKEFAKALSNSDAVILADIYAAREKDTLGISSRDLCEEIEKLNTECYYISTFEEIEKFIKKTCTPNDMLITMGAGDIVNVGENLLRE